MVGLLLTVLGGSWGILGASLVFLAVVWTIAALVVLPDGVRAWRTGAVGEEMTASALATLPAGVFVVLHDHRKPKSRANIDHVVLGPTSIWVVETKNYAGSLSVRDGDLWIAGRRKTGAAFPSATWDRLRQLKRRLDPANRLRFNANIPPADG